MSLRSSKRNRAIADMSPVKADPKAKKTKINVDDDEELETEMVGSAESLLSDIFGGKPVNDGDVSKAILFLMLNLRSKFNYFKSTFDKKFEVYDEKFEDLENRVQELESRNNELEVNLVAKDLIFRKVPLHSEAVDGLESPDQTRQQITAIFTDLKMTLKDYEFPETFRVKPKKDPTNNDNTRTPIIIVRFPFATHIRLLFEQMKKELNSSSTSKFKALSVDKSVPRCLMTSYSAANAKAYDLRTKKKWKTRVEIEGGNVVLKTKSKGAATWSTIPPTKWTV